MESTVSPPRVAARRWRILAFTCFIVVALYAVLGGLVLPFVGKHVLETRLGERIGRAVQVDQITFNPFTLKASLEGVRVLERDGKATFVSLVSLDLGGSFHSIVELAPVADSVELRGLRVNLVREEANRYNLSDILGRLAQPSPSSEKPRFSLSNIRLVDAQVDFDDRPMKARHRLSEVNLAIPFISTLPAHRRDFIQPAFAAKVNGTPLAVEGETQPFDQNLRSQVSVTIGALELKRYLGYSPVPLPINLESGVLDTQMSARFTQNGNGAPTIMLSGTAALRDAQVSAERTPLARFARLEARIHEFDPIAGKGHVTMVRLQDATTPDGRWRLAHAEANDIRLDLAHRIIEISDLGVKGGTLALERAPSGAIEMPWRAPAGAPGDPSSPWTVTIARLGVDDTSAVLVDRAVSPPATHRLAVAVQANDLTTREGGKGVIKARLTIGKNGRAEIASTFSLEPFAARAEIEASRIDLVALRPYAKQFPDVALLHGFASARGRVAVRMQGDGLSLSYAGGAEVTKLATVDTTRKEDLLNWDSLAVKGIALEWSPRAPLDLAISDVLLENAYS